MKILKTLKHIALLIGMLLMSFVGVGQNTLTVHDGTATNSYVPVYGFYTDAYLKCEMVYPASELSDMTGGTIAAMTFYANSPASASWGDANFQVFLKEVNDGSISAFNGTDGATIVYEGALDGTGSTMEISFTTPYTYNGGNLLLGIYNTVIGTYKSISFKGETVSDASVQGYSYSSLDAVSPTQRNFIPKTTFEYEANNDVHDCYATITLTVGDVWGDGTGYQILLDSDANTYGSIIPETGGLTSSGDASSAIYAEFEYKIPENADGSLTTSNIIFENSITIQIPAGIYDWCVTNPTPGDRLWIASSNGNIGGRANDYTFECGENYEFIVTLDGSNDRVDVILVPPAPPREQCQVGDNWGTSTNSYLPSYSLYNYSLTQQIYTADEIGNSGIIGEIGFYNNGTSQPEETRIISIYINTTDKENFEDNTDWISDIGNNVYEGTVMFSPNSWTVLTLATQFNYNGIDNLVITVDDNSNHWESSISYRVYSANGNQAIRVYSDDTNYDPTNPSQYSGTIMNVKNQIKLCTEEGWPLPISLLSFTASPQPEYNLVQWSTATEKNNDLFILERSEDAVVFDEVYNVSGAGNSLEPIDYEFRDYCPVPDITYYRLTQVDYDGSKTTSEIVSCIRTSEKMSNWEYFTKYDNLLQVHSNDKVLTIVCSDLLGRTIWQGKLLPHDDEELVLKVPYMVHIYEDGNLVGSEKILK